ncbi:hypothetical protein EZS27_012589 [termite gut metagenome]|uniref:Uncharacterized protein n=1 Tax=termite gut metagenome TaxID=433724 RepID=A0A5J4S1W3_9ZZZZ
MPYTLYLLFCMGYSAGKDMDNYSYSIKICQ